MKNENCETEQSVRNDTKGTYNIAFLNYTCHELLTGANFAIRQTHDIQREKTFRCKMLPKFSVMNRLKRRVQYILPSVLSEMSYS